MSFWTKAKVAAAVLCAGLFIGRGTPLVAGRAANAEDAPSVEALANRENRKRMLKLETQKVGDSYEIKAPSYFMLVYKPKYRPAMTFQFREQSLWQDRPARMAEVYDLKHDPDKKVNLAAVYADINGDCIPNSSIHLREASSTRVVIDIRGVFYENEENEKEKKGGIGLTRRSTIYPTGQIYVRNIWSGALPDRNLGGGRVGSFVNGSCSFAVADQHGEILDDPKYWVNWGGRQEYVSKKQSPFLLYHSTRRHPRELTHVQDMGPVKGPVEIIDVEFDLLNVSHYHTGRVYYFGRWQYWGTKRASQHLWFEQLKRLPFDAPDSLTQTFLVQIKPATMDNREAVLPYVGNYRNPAALKFTNGSAVKDDPNDVNKDGYDESEGCYLMRPLKGVVEFSIGGPQEARFYPVFKIKDWEDDAPKRIRLDRKELEIDYDYNAAIIGNDLVLQYLGVIQDTAAFKIGDFRGQDAH